MFSFSRSLIDRIMVGGWIAILLTGQAVLNVECRPLEWFALLWLCVGMLAVRSTVCLPLLLLTCPAFMCEIHRYWAPGQILVVCVWLGRMLVERRFSTRQYLCIALTGAVVFAWSWPGTAPELIVKLKAESWHELLRQWLHPQAVWPMFPFRQASDRALVAMVGAVVALDHRYFASGTVWKALRWCGLLALMAAFSAALIPWQKSHVFLGTANYAVVGNSLFHGAGSNLHYFAVLVAVGLPWLLIPFGSSRIRPLGAIALLLPTVFVLQEAYWLSVAASIAAVIGFLVYALMANARLGKLARRVWGSRRRVAQAGLLLVVSLVVSVSWFWKLRFWDAGSILWQIWKPNYVVVRPFVGIIICLLVTGLVALLCLPLVSRWQRRHAAFVRPKAGRQYRSVVLIGALAVVVLAGWFVATHRPLIPALHRLFDNRLALSARVDQSRAAMWKLGMNHSLEHVWKGGGAGTWARFHRSQPRPYREYYAHMHNTYLDLIFEYGLVPMLMVYGLCGIALLRIAFGYGGVSRLWLLYFIPVATMALSQHLFFAFTHLCLLLPAFVLVPRALAGLFRAAP